MRSTARRGCALALAALTLLPAAVRGSFTRCHPRRSPMLPTWSARRSPRPRFHPRVERLDDRLAPAVFTVLNTNDSGPDSLRQAILDTNATPGADEIRFDLGAEGSSHTIRPVSELPALTDTVLLDGWSQGPDGYRGRPLVALDG